ncbi:hypothetical protein GC207_08460 [bacterium]|nr:hypothetical protein [bacterium]
MKPIKAAMHVASMMALTGCLSREPSPNSSTLKWHPVEHTVSTQEQLNSALMARWPVRLIGEYCRSVRSTPATFQNLVASGDYWENDLYRGEKTGFDRIWWYASLTNGMLDEYSLNATKGRKHWIVEFGNLQTLTRPPNIPKSMGPGGWGDQ